MFQQKFHNHLLEEKGELQLDDRCDKGYTPLHQPQQVCEGTEVLESKKIK